MSAEPICGLTASLINPHFNETERFEWWFGSGSPHEVRHKYDYLLQKTGLNVGFVYAELKMSTCKLSRYSITFIKIILMSSLARML